jgi:hypothetical protein
MAEQERKACEIELGDVKPADRFQVGDWVQTMFGPLQVQGFVGQTLRLEAGGLRIRLDAAMAEGVASPC